MTLLLARQFSELTGTTGQSMTTDQQGTSWASVNRYQEVLFCWISTVSSQHKVLGRIDSRGVIDDIKKSPTILSSNNGAEGVRCCFNPHSDGWIVCYNVGRTVYYKLCDRVLNQTVGDTALTNFLPVESNSSSYNLGCSQNGDFYISCSGRCVKINSSYYIQHIAIPSYFYPGSFWTQMNNATPTVQLAIINPNSGPGASQNQDYVSQVTSSKNSGLIVIGYVPTNYEARSSAVVKADIDKYYEWYDIDGIFFDECSTSSNKIRYYEDLNDYVKSKTGLCKTVINPGIDPDEGYVNVADIICNFEDTYANYTSWTPSLWVNKYSPSKFWHLILNCQESNMPNAIAMSKTKNAGWVYVTLDNLPNPWDTLPSGSYWTNELLSVGSITDSTTIEKNISVSGGLRMYVHMNSGYVELTRTFGSDLIIDRYNQDLVYYATITIASSDSLNEKLHDIVGYFGGDEGFFVVYIDGATGDNIHYRAFSGDGLPLYDTKTIAGTGHVDISSNKGRLSCSIGELTCIEDIAHTLAIRATSTNASSSRVIALIEPDRFDHKTIEKTEIIPISDANSRYGSPIIAPNQFEIRNFKPNLSTGTMEVEVYVRPSVWASLWRLETNSYVFYNHEYDSSARADIESIFTSYPTESKLAGEQSSSVAGYKSAPGRGTVDVASANFATFLGTEQEDTVIIGGPKKEYNEISNEMENNPNMFDTQVYALRDILGFSAFEFVVEDREVGWDLGTLSPEIKVTVGGIEYSMQRHLMDAGLWYRESEGIDIIVDYAVIIRLPITASGVQDSKSLLYIAGINACGTRAAAYVLKNALTYKLGSSCSHLVILEHDDRIGMGSNHSVDWKTYAPGLIGNIRVYPLHKIASQTLVKSGNDWTLSTTTTNFEGIR